MSGYTSDFLGSRRVPDAGYALIEKPFHPTALTEKVREVLGVPA
jgi:hypothetical protein